MHLRCAIAGPLLMAAVAWADDLAVQYRNTVPLAAAATDQFGVTFTVAGLSGLAFAGGDRWWACLDNSDTLIELAIALNADGSIASAFIVRGLRLTTAADTEDIAILQGSAWLADESPLLQRISLATGAIEASAALPPVFANVRPNFGLESLAATPGGGYLTANEEALSVDGPLSTPASGTLVRLLELATVDGGLLPGAQFAYLTAPIHGPTTTGARSGLCALVSLSSGRTLALERSFALNFASLFQTRIYEVDFSGATRIEAYASIVTPTPVPPIATVTKRLLHRANHANLEGLALGPALASGGYALIGIVDDGDPISTNQLVAFRLTGPVEALCASDIDRDGDADSDDIATFFAQWDLGDPAADIDADGDTDSDDIVVYFAAFEEGC